MATKKSSSKTKVRKWKQYRGVHPLTGTRTCPYVDLREKRCMAGDECPIGRPNLMKTCYNLSKASYAKVVDAAGGIRGWL